MEDTDKKRVTEMTATELVMHVLDEFSMCEGRKALVVWTNDDDEVVVTTNAHRVEGIGMLTVGVDILMRKFEKVP